MSEDLTAQNMSQQQCPNGPDEEKADPKLSRIAKLSKVVGTVVVWTALGGLAVWGHFSGWTMPKFSELTGSRPSDKADWCSEHGVPESLCIECNPAVLPDQE